MAGVVAVLMLLTAGLGRAQPLAPTDATRPREDNRKFTEARSVFSAAATSPGIAVDTANREESRLFFQAIYPASENVAMGWTGSYASSDPLAAAGNTAAAFKDAVQLRVNFFRAMAGVPADVTFDSGFNAKAQLAAIMMSVNNAIVHAPPADWQLYTADGALAASKSNLALGVAGPSAIDGYIADPSEMADPTINAPVGHRRWVLYPQTRYMGSGDVPGGDTLPAANALWVLDESFGAERPFVRESFVAWPAPGYVPYRVVYPRWSISYPEADFSAASVTMSRDGAAVPVVLEPVANGYGENTLVWIPDGLDTSATTPHERPSADVTYEVTVSNVVVDGQAQTFSYSVIVFDPEVDGADTEPVAITGPASPFVGQDNTYTVGGLYYATGFQWRTVSTSPYSAIEGAENGASGLNITSTGGYDVVTVSAEASGDFGFHLAHATLADQIVELDRTFLAAADAHLTFQSRLGYATEDQVARVQLSLDDGATWSDAFVQAGSNGAGESSFSLRSLSLADLNGRTFRVRFAFTFSTGAYYPGASADIGWSFDDIMLTGVESVEAGSTSSTEAGSQFSFTPGAAGDHALQARGVFYGAYPLSWGPIKRVSAVAATPTAPSFTLQPESRTVEPGANVTFPVAVTGFPAPQLQWFKDGIELSGATSASLSLLAVGSSDAGSYTVVATNSVGTATSAAAVLVVENVPTAPSIVVPPMSVSVVEGQPLTLNVSANGYPSLNYAWKHNGSSIPGATLATYSVASASSAHAGEYQVVVNNSEGTATSPAATVTIFPAVAITVQPANQVISAGQSAMLSVSATGTGLTYQWYAGAAGDTSAPLAGAVQPAFTTPALDVSSRFWVRVSSPAQSVDSAAALVDVTTPARYFFGTIGGSGEGLFGLIVRPEGSATFIGCIQSPGTLIDGRSVSIDAGGAFSFDGGAGVGTVSGTITNQSVTGSIAASALPFTGSEVTTVGAAAAMAGFFEAVHANTASDRAFVMAGPDGPALVMSSRGGVWSAAMLPVSAAGSIGGTLPDEQALALNLNASTGRISGTTMVAGTTWRVAGARSGFQLERRIDNLSVRAQVQQGQSIMITGFVVSGTGTKNVLVRGVGPGLAQFGVASPLQDPVVQVYREGETLPIANNDDWGSAGNAASLVAAADLVGAFDIDFEGRDAGVLLSLPAGSYTAHVSGKDGGTGPAIVELYDADESLGAPSTASLSNISMRGLTGQGENLVIAGFVVSGAAPKKLLIRGVGPELAQWISGFLPNPVLRLFQDDDVIAENNDWDAGGNAAAVVEASTTVGAFPMEAGSGSAALVIWLEPGSYTAQLGSNDASTGLAIVEVYEMP
ncbi:MAG: immunoglobulin domain-containing protein [Opitutaceae bacterium]